VSIERKGFIWNSIAGIINAAEAVVMLMIVMRFSTIDDAGILTMAFAVGNLLMTIGKFGIKNFQVTDQKEEYDFSTYFWLRVITVFVMLISGGGYLLYGTFFLGYSIHKTISISCIIGIYVFESVEDLYWGRYQQCGRLDIGAKLFAYRWIATLLLFMIIQIVSRDFVLALISSTVVSITIGSGLIVITSKGFECAVYRKNMKSVAELLKVGFSLFFIAFLMFYITNASKYSIDRFLGDKEQACYGFIFMPVFVIELLNNFLYQPTLVGMTREWTEKKLNAVKRRIWKQLALIVGLTICVLLGGYLLGIPVLSLLYNTNLDEYKMEFMLLLIGGGMLAFQGYFTVVLTVMRKQKFVSYVFIMAAIITFIIINSIVKRFSIMGAALYYLGIMAFISIILGIEIVLVMEKERSKQKDK